MYDRKKRISLVSCYILTYLTSYNRTGPNSKLGVEIH